MASPFRSHSRSSSYRRVGDAQEVHSEDKRHRGKVAVAVENPATPLFLH